MKVQILSCTPNPGKLLHQVWNASRQATDIKPIAACPNDIDLMKLIFEQDAPVSEFLTLVIAIDDAPVAFREQLVRHRLCTFWIQSSRIMDLGQAPMWMPNTLNAEQQALLRDGYAHVKDSYRKMQAAGVPNEMARLVMPEGRLHRIQMMINFRYLIQMCSKRTCWILQASLWKYFVSGIQRELERLYDANGCDEAYRVMAAQIGSPPCTTSKKCKFCLDNERRLKGEDNLPVCPLWAKFYDKDLDESQKTRAFEYYKTQGYEEMWSEDPFKPVPDLNAHICNESCSEPCPEAQKD